MFDVEAEVDKAEAAQKKTKDDAKAAKAEKEKTEKANAGLEEVAKLAKEMMDKNGVTVEQLKKYFDQLAQNEETGKKTQAAYAKKANPVASTKVAN